MTYMDIVRYYFKKGNCLEVHYGVVRHISQSIVFPDRKRYGVERIDNSFVDFGYREDFFKVERSFKHFMKKINYAKVNDYEQ